jgi:hypothetical protein
LLCPLADGCSAAGQVIERKPRKQAPFAGSSRYVRGRILDALRTQPDETWLTPERLAELVAGERVQVEKLARRMAEEGLLAIDEVGSVRLA